MTQAPLVTLGITSFNAADTIVRAIDSALAQDWPNTEIVIVDDGSSDETVAVITERIAGVDGARLIVHAHNTGAGGARNTILEAARGAFIAFFDDDDVSAPARVTAQIAALEACEAATGSALVACYAGGERLYANGHRVDAPAIGSEGETPHGHGVADYLLIYGKREGWFFGAGVPSCALLARASTFTAAGGFDIRMRRDEDVDFAISLALAGGYFTGTRERLYVRHMTGGADKSPELMRDSKLVLAEKYKDYLSSIHRYEYARRWPVLRYWHFKRRYGRFALEFLGLFVRHPIAATRHLLSTGPRRLAHERRIKPRD
ncbi:glycosyltransferase family 2 protein [Pelagibacterium montanilacus]|uniref:glycosyltransferase family 2 protein n=1 Tax=Pelagibacterium montanilacus TaxID=2185280 RepID=UPI0013DF5777|nr:glycosyltransferase [Pelagibacterium montanilacus]